MLLRGAELNHTDRVSYCLSTDEYLKKEDEYQSQQLNVYKYICLVAQLVERLESRVSWIQIPPRAATFFLSLKKGVVLGGIELFVLFLVEFHMPRFSLLCAFTHS